ncbi:MAG: 2-dehydropantoate 2-reductase [Armatimonadota bacterium]|nr:2-dehydropantoate 2-reductase [Armatimonadota bacterium]MDR7439521.1 2-dehydropantoate 2-reductase [Armatimonadota bacterium]MDR7563439.1 2-dehydropantoate 2-reductase [Armatimonadota bacterium]MDR7567465.1 2-dehydropantoate 2-reductase [Armatimonadota bacterium]MDR7601277.1 2-dehydropantoate 2-reductase [Armatimonadota bacterium]
MRFGIIGAGAMGCRFGVHLAEAGHEVWLVDVWEEQVAALRRHGVRVDDGVHPRFVRVQATGDPAEAGIVDYLLIFTKSHHTRQAAQSAMPMAGSRTWVVTLQNGLGNVEALSEVFRAERILAGVCFLWSDLVAPGWIRWTPHPVEIHLGPVDPSGFGGAQELATLLTEAGLPAHALPDPREAIWYKVAFNAAANALSAITRLPVGPLVAQPATREIFERLVAEAAAVAAAEGVSLDPRRVLDTLMGRHRSPEERTHLPSMLQDVLRRRPTEIAFLNGEIIRRAERHGIPVPYNTLLTRIVEILERTYPQQVLHLDPEA